MTSGPVQITSIVEGHGEVEGLPVLVRRIAEEIFGLPYVIAHKPHRVPKGRMQKPGELARVVRLQSGRVAGTGGVLVLTDADDDDPAELKSSLQATCDSAALSATIVSIAVREYEAWFLAAVESLRPLRSVADDATYAGNPETPRDAKGALEECMTESYSSIRHQPSFNARLDIVGAAAKAPSLQRFVDAVGQIIDRNRESATDKDASPS